MLQIFLCIIQTHTYTYIHPQTIPLIWAGLEPDPVCVMDLKMDRGLNGFLWLMYSIKSSMSGLSCIAGFRLGFFRICQKKINRQSKKLMGNK